MFRRLSLRWYFAVQGETGNASKPVTQTRFLQQTFNPTVKTILVIVESPNKVKLIENYLRPIVENNQQEAQRVKVMATIGHFMEMIDVKLNEKFSVKWQLTPEKQSTIKTVREAIRHPLITEVVLASDPDREGELIAAHVHDALFPKKDAPNFSRAYFYAMTNDMIVDGFQKRQESFIDKNLVESALARHIIDRMFGFTASACLMLHDKKCRSIGRVQTPALNLIQERECDIQEYEKRGVTYTYSIDPVFNVTGKGSTLGELKGTLCGEWDASYSNEKECETSCAELSKVIRGTSPKKIAVKESTKSKSPPVPFTMVTLIDAASRILRMKGDAVTNAAQTLFTKGLITYPRSDSERLSDDFEKSLAQYVRDTYGKAMVFAGKKVRKASANAEGAHEAIRPTDLRKSPSEVHVEEGNVRALYALIHDHTVASRVHPIVTKSVALTVDFDVNPLVQAKITHSYIQDFGYLKAFDESIVQSKQTEDQSESKKRYAAILALKPEDICLSDLTVARHSDSKPTRFTEGTLITVLKDAGIGRPSTYATTLQKLSERGYSTYFDANGKLALGQNGKIASEFAKKNFENFVKIDFTSAMESQLNDIAQGSKARVDIVKTFWDELKGCISHDKNRESATVQEFMDNLQRFCWGTFPAKVTERIVKKDSMVHPKTSKGDATEATTRKTAKATKSKSKA